MCQDASLSYVLFETFSCSGRLSNFELLNLLFVLQFSYGKCSGGLLQIGLTRIQMGFFLQLEMSSLWLLLG